MAAKSNHVMLKTIIMVIYIISLFSYLIISLGDYNQAYKYQQLHELLTKKEFNIDNGSKREYTRYGFAAVSSDETISIEYNEFTSAERAKEVYDQIVDQESFNIDIEHQSFSTNLTTDSAYIEFRTLDFQYYVYMSRVGNRVLYSKTKIENQKEIINILTEAKYYFADYSNFSWGVIGIFAILFFVILFYFFMYL